MGLSLSAEIQKLIEERMLKGGYSSPDDLLRRALNVLDDHMEAENLDDEDLTAIEESERQIARGEDLDWKVVSAELRQRYIGE